MSKRKANARRMRFFKTFTFEGEKITPITHSFTPTKMTAEELKLFAESFEKLEFEKALEEAIDESVEDAIREVEPSIGSVEKVW